MSLPIISADERLAEKRGVKGVLVVGRKNFDRYSSTLYAGARRNKP